jgi:hypothetical protein
VIDDVLIVAQGLAIDGPGGSWARPGPPTSGPGRPARRRSGRPAAFDIADLGYQADLDAAEPFALPSLAALAEAGAPGARAAPRDDGIVLPVIPVVLSERPLGLRSARAG